MKRRRLFIALAVLVAALIAFWWSASADRCGTWPQNPPGLNHIARGRGNLKAGAAKAQLQPIFPTTAGGYGPLRSTVDHATSPLFARALVLDVGGQQLGIVLLDALLIPPQLRDAIGEGQKFPVWVLATHTHSGPSGFDPRLASELAALGSYHPDDFKVLVTAGRAALADALAAVQPAKLDVGEALVEGVSIPRSGKEVDRRLTRLQLNALEGAPLAQVIIASAHPTLVERRPEGLHPDWPGLLAERMEKDKGPITLVMQGSAGNASVDRSRLASPDDAAARFDELTRSLPLRAQPEVIDAAWTEVHVSLPRPRADRVVPSFLTAAAENALCDDAEDLAVLHGLRLGEVRLLFVPLEPSFAAGQVLEEQAHATRLVSLADGYAGYVETVEAARAAEGESKRQYFPPELLVRLAEGAKLAGKAIE